MLAFINIKMCKKGNIISSKIIEHMWENTHTVNWNQMKIIDKKQKGFGQKLKEMCYISANNKCTSQVNKECL